jgi:hypothetical protein
VAVDEAVGVMAFFFEGRLKNQGNIQVNPFQKIIVFVDYRKFFLAATSLVC